MLSRVMGFNSNILWAVEFTVFLFGWMVLLGASYAVKNWRPSWGGCRAESDFTKIAQDFWYMIASLRLYRFLVLTTERILGLLGELCQFTGHRWSLCFQPDSKTSFGASMV